MKYSFSTWFQKLERKFEETWNVREVYSLRGSRNFLLTRRICKPYFPRGIFITCYLLPVGHNQIWRLPSGMRWTRGRRRSGWPRRPRLTRVRDFVTKFSGICTKSGLTGLFNSKAKLPKMEKMVKPARSDVKVSATEMIKASLRGDKYGPSKLDSLSSKLSFSVSPTSSKLSLSMTLLCLILPVCIVSVSVERGKRDQRPEAHRKTEERLGHGGVPRVTEFSY